MCDELGVLCSRLRRPGVLVVDAQFIDWKAADTPEWLRTLFLEWCEPVLAMALYDPMAKRSAIGRFIQAFDMEITPCPTAALETMPQSRDEMLAAPPPRCTYNDSRNTLMAIYAYYRRKCFFGELCLKRPLGDAISEENDIHNSEEHQRITRLQLMWPGARKLQSLIGCLEDPDVVKIGCNMPLFVESMWVHHRVCVRNAVNLAQLTSLPSTSPLYLHPTKVVNLGEVTQAYASRLEDIHYVAASENALMSPADLLNKSAMLDAAAGASQESADGETTGETTGTTGVANENVATTSVNDPAPQPPPAEKNEVDLDTDQLKQRLVSAVDALREAIHNAKGCISVAQCELLQLQIHDVIEGLYLGRFGSVQ